MRGRVARAGVLASVITTIALVAEVLVAVPVQAAEVDDRPVTSLPAVTSDAVPAPTPTVPDGVVDAPKIAHDQAPTATADDRTKALGGDLQPAAPESPFDPDTSKLGSAAGAALKAGSRVARAAWTARVTRVVGHRAARRAVARHRIASHRIESHRGACPTSEDRSLGIRWGRSMGASTTGTSGVDGEGSATCRSLRQHGSVDCVADLLNCVVRHPSESPQWHRGAAHASVRDDPRCCGVRHGVFPGEEPVHGYLHQRAGPCCSELVPYVTMGSCCDNELPGRELRRLLERRESRRKWPISQGDGFRHQE